MLDQAEGAGRVVMRDSCGVLFIQRLSRAMPCRSLAGNDRGGARSMASPPGVLDASSPALFRLDAARPVDRCCRAAVGRMRPGAQSVRPDLPEPGHSW